jgi:hypothetical protein
MNSIYNSIKDIVSNLDLTIYVCSNVGNSVKTKDTLYIVNGDKLSDDNGVIYTVDNLVVNEGFDLIPDNGISVFNLDKLYFEGINLPTYLTGKALSVNSEYQQISRRTREKVPFVWLVTGFKEDLDVVENPMIYSNIKLFFLSDTNERKWLTEQHYDIVINRMRNLAIRFLDYIKNSAKYEYNRANLISQERFGVYISNGAKEKIIDEDLSGVCLEVELRINKDC